MGVRCDGSHEHVTIQGSGPDGKKRSTEAAVYSPGTVRAIVKLVLRQRLLDERRQRGDRKEVLDSCWAEEDREQLARAVFTHCPASEEPGQPQDEEGGDEEKRLSQTAEVKAKVANIHENMGHPSTKTLVRILKTGRAKTRFIIAAAAHRCAACEAQRRPKGPLPSRSPHTYLFNDVVGADVIFIGATGEL